MKINSKPKPKIQMVLELATNPKPNRVRTKSQIELGETEKSNKDKRAGRKEQGVLGVKKGQGPN
jgi:hypothetical protein